MAWDPNQQHKFVSRKFRLSLEDNYHLDKKWTDRLSRKRDEKKKLTFNVWVALAISAVILIIAFVLPSVVKSAVVRRRTDALVDLGKTRDALSQAEMDRVISDDTLFVIEESERYFLFWYKSGANVVAKDGENPNGTYVDFVEISKPLDNRPPVNVQSGESLIYPFKEAPVKTQSGSVTLMPGLQLLSGYTIEEYPVGDELGKLLKSNVQLYRVVKK